MSTDIDTIVEKIWNDLKKNSTKSEPFALFTMGLPASGKSESIDLVIEDIGLSRSDFIIIDPDEFMKYIPGYRNNNARSFNKDGVIISSRILKLINDSAKNYNYIYFGTGKNFKSYQTMINKANKNGYTTILVNVEITLEKAKQRARKRSMKASLLLHRRRFIRDFTVESLIRNLTHYKEHLIIIQLERKTDLQ